MAPHAHIHEGRYNGRDVLSMCRAFEYLREAVERTDTVAVYLTDRAMAHLALQMTRAGLPIDDAERKRVGDHLRQLRDDAAKRLKQFTEGAYRDAFVEWAARFMASKARKTDPQGGQADPDTGLPMSEEIAFQKRVIARRAQFVKTLEKKGINIGAKIQQAALLRAAGVPMLKMTEKSKLPKINKETLEEVSMHAVAKDMLQWTLTAAAVRNFIDGIPIDADGRFRPEWNVTKITGRWGSSPNCFDGETEILTTEGWVPFPKLTKRYKVAQFDKVKQEISFVAPEAIIRKRFYGDMVRLERRNIDLLVTPDHRLLLETRDGEQVDVLAQDFRSNMRMPIAATCFDCGYTPSAFKIAFTCAAQADGTWNGSGWHFGFTRRRKIWRMRWILRSAGVQYTEETKRVDDPFKPGKKRSRTIFYVKKCALGDEAACLLGPGKTFGSWLLSWSRTAREAFLDEIMNWDGSYTRRNCYSSSVKANADMVQAVATITGRRARLRSYTRSKIQKKANWQVDLSPRTWTWTTNTAKSTVSWGGRMVYCVTVPAHYIVVRRGKNVMITGQCQNWSKRAGGGVENLRRMIGAPPGWVFVGADQAQLEARLIACASRDPFLVDIFARGGDIHSEMAVVAFPAFEEANKIFKEHKKAGRHDKNAGTNRCGPSEERPYCDFCELRNKLRDLTKRLEYGAFYGGAELTLWTSIVKDYPEIKLDLVRAFLANVNKRMGGVIAWRAQVLRDAIEKGEIRSPILGRREVFPMGRVEPTVAYNYIPQSGGADLWALGAIKFCEKYPQDTDKARIVHNGHDSVLILTREEDAEEVAKAVHECWETTINGVPFLMDTKIGKRWSET